MAELAAMARRRQPGLIMADRTVGGEYEDFVTPEQAIPDAPLPEPWESCLTLGGSWKYVEHDRFKPAADVIRMLAETASKGGNLLLGFGPDPLGRLPEEAVARLREVGRWMAANGEAIYGTRPVAPYGSGGVRFTSKGKTTYAIVLDVCDEDKRRGIVSIASMWPVPGSEVRMLGAAEPVRWSASEAGFEAAWRPAHNGMATAYRFERDQR
jgi:alpha-L-fucosidase